MRRTRMTFGVPPLGGLLLDGGGAQSTVRGAILWQPALPVNAPSSLLLGPARDLRVYETRCLNARRA